VAREGKEFDGFTKTVCPVHGRPVNDGANDDQASASGQVKWAGLPINLDLAFSREQRDKVYVQHLMRKRGIMLWRWSHDGGQPCCCEAPADQTNFDQHAADSMPSR